MAVNMNEDVVRELEVLGRDWLQPESVSPSGKGMTHLSDKSQVISRSAEAVLTKKDLPQDGHHDRDDGGAPLDFLIQSVINSWATVATGRRQGPGQ